MSNKKGLLALSPLFLLIVLIVAFTIYSVDSSHQDTSLSLTVAFMISSIYAVAISGGMPVRKRVEGKSACYKVVQQLLEKSREQNGSLICAEILGLKGHDKAVSTYEASPRTAEYYKSRPCAAKVESAARIFAEYLQAKASLT